MRIVIFGCGNIGFETVKILEKENFIEKIFVLNRSYPQYLKEALEGNLLDKNKVNFFKVNAEDENAISTVFSSGIKEKIDVLVCALGVYSTLPSTKDFNQFKTDFDNNVFSNLIPVKVALNQEIFNDNARIVVMSSTVANFAPFELCSYASSKWCLENICFSRKHITGRGTGTGDSPMWTCSIPVLRKNL